MGTKVGRTAGGIKILNKRKRYKSEYLLVGVGYGMECDADLKNGKMVFDQALNRKYRRVNVE